MTTPISNTQPSLRLVRPASVAPARVQPEARASRVQDRVEISSVRSADRVVKIETKSSQTIERASRTAALVAGFVREHPVEKEPQAASVATESTRSELLDSQGPGGRRHQPPARVAPPSAAIRFYQTPAEQSAAYTAARSLDVRA